MKPLHRSPKLHLRYVGHPSEAPPHEDHPVVVDLRIEDHLRQMLIPISMKTEVNQQLPLIQQWQK